MSDRIEFEKFLKEMEAKKEEGSSGIGAALAFSDPSYPGKRLEKKINELLANPPRFDRYGQKIAGMNYSKAFDMAMEQNPGLAKAYAESVLPKKEVFL